MAGRAADERDDGRRGHAAAGVPGHPPRRETERSAAWIRSQQRADGTWANFYGGPGELSTTIEAYWALRLAGDDAGGASTCARPRRFIRASRVGCERARVFTHVWLALFGLWPWERVPALPPEVVLLPSWVPLNVYDFACWARQTIVALSLVKAHRPVRPLPFDLDELHAAEPAPATARARARRRAPWLARLDRVLRAYERRPIGPLRRLALGRAERWIVRRQEADGSWGGIQPPWVYSLMALHLGGYPLDHPVMRRGLEGLERLHGRGPRRRPRRRRAGRRQPPPGSLPVARLGHRAGDRRAQRRRAAGRAPGAASAPPTGCSARRSRVPRRLGGRRPAPAPGGWAFEFANVNYPDVDDTAEVVLALRCAPPAHRGRRADGSAAAGEQRDRPRACAGSRACRAPTAAGARSTPTTRARSCASCRSWTSAR